MGEGDLNRILRNWLLLTPSLVGLPSMVAKLVASNCSSSLFNFR
ncbi:hypothetical protein Leryth_025716 [Lithospermum erythrorhizon]|nr:hypothetical protein Leryth_025716 [Lithospermum erythrorhizon]